MHDAKHGKALRGDLRISVPTGCIWHREIGLGLDPNERASYSPVFARSAAPGRHRFRSRVEHMHFRAPKTTRPW